jgi:isoleucyl-tRNA synthetase
MDYSCLVVLTVDLQVADKEIMKVLKAKGRLIVQSTIKHSYPFCWR